MSNTYSEMSESADKHRKIYVYHTDCNSKPRYLIHGPGHSSGKYKVLGDSGSNQVKIRHTNNRGHNPANRNKYTRKRYNNDIVNSEVDEIILQENDKVSAGK